MPPPGQGGPEASDRPMPPMGEGGMPQGGPMQFNKQENDSTRTVWLKGANGVHPKRITVGVTDEINYEVVNGLNEGDEVITGVTTTGGVTSATKTPSRGLFSPPRPGSNRTSTTTNRQQGPPPM